MAAVTTYVSTNICDSRRVVTEFLYVHIETCTRRVHGVCTCTRGLGRWPCTRCTRVMILNQHQCSGSRRGSARHSTSVGKPGVGRVVRRSWKPTAEPEARTARARAALPVRPQERGEGSDPGPRCQITGHPSVGASPVQHRCVVHLSCLRGRAHPLQSHGHRSHEPIAARTSQSAHPKQRLTH
jgi:hypothetical protein